jgi:hypothetical protein
VPLKSNAYEHNDLDQWFLEIQSNLEQSLVLRMEHRMLIATQEYPFPTPSLVLGQLFQ